MINNFSVKKFYSKFSKEEAREILLREEPRIKMSTWVWQQNKQKSIDVMEGLFHTYYSLFNTSLLQKYFSLAVFYYILRFFLNPMKPKGKLCFQKA